MSEPDSPGGGVYPSEGVQSAPPVRERLRAFATAAIVIGLTVNLAIAAAGIWVVSNPQRVSDQFAVWSFTPSAEVEQHVLDATMTDEAEFLFYASRPVVEANAQFDQRCSTAEEAIGVLGCYLLRDKVIYLFDVTDERLDGLQTVVAAHETLHAAWDRMSEDEHDRLAPLLEAEAAKLADNELFAERLAYYAQAEPGERLNELHSIIGSEIAGISSELEAHYARYFSDRSVLTAITERTDAVFAEFEERAAALVAQIDALVVEVEAEYAAYNAGYDQLNADVDSFNVRADTVGAFESQSEFDRERNALIQRQSELDAAYNTITAKVATYDALVVELDSINSEGETLYEAINIDPPRQPED